MKQILQSFGITRFTAAAAAMALNHLFGIVYHTVLRHYTYVHSSDSFPYVCVCHSAVMRAIFRGSESQRSIQPSFGNLDQRPMCGVWLL